MDYIKRNDSLSTFCLLIMLLYCIISIMPISQVFIPALYSEGLLLLWFFLSILVRIKRRIPFSLLDGSVLTVASLIVFYKISEISTESWGTLFNELNFLVSLLMIEFSLKVLNRTQIRLFFWVLYLSLLTYVIYGSIFSFFFADVFLPTNFDEYAELVLLRTSLNLGDTYHDLMILFFFCVTYLMFLMRARNKLLFLLIAIITGYYLVFVSQRATISLYMLFVVCVIPFIVQNKRNKIRLVIIGSIISLLIFVFFADNLAIMLKNILPERIADRLSDIDDSMNKGVSGDSFSGRTGLVFMSIDTWLSSITSFFFGIGERMAQDLYYKRGAIGVGGHADGFDFLAKYGIVGWGAIMLMFFRFFKMVNRCINTHLTKSIFNFLFLLFIVCYFTKVVFFFQIGIGAIILIPLWAYMKDNHLINIS